MASLCRIFESIDYFFYGMHPRNNKRCLLLKLCETNKQGPILPSTFLNIVFGIAEALSTYSTLIRVGNEIHWILRATSILGLSSSPVQKVLCICLRGEAHSMLQKHPKEQTRLRAQRFRRYIYIFRMFKFLRRYRFLHTSSGRTPLPQIESSSQKSIKMRMGASRNSLSLLKTLSKQN